MAAMDVVVPPIRASGGGCLLECGVRRPGGVWIWPWSVLVMFWCEQIWCVEWRRKEVGKRSQSVSQSAFSLACVTQNP